MEKIVYKKIVKMESNIFGTCSTYGKYVLNSRQYLHAQIIVFFPSKPKVASRDAPCLVSYKIWSMEFGYFYFFSISYTTIYNHFWWVHMD